MKSRKLWGGIALIVIALITVVIGKATEFMAVSQFILSVFGLYVIGNVGEHFTQK